METGVKHTEYGLSVEKIEAALRADGAPDVPVFLYGEVSSTSDLARAYAKEGGGAAVFIAESQTAGRGRRGRRFSSPAGSGVYMSLLVFPTHGASEGVLLTTGAAVAACRAVERVSGLRPEIKWVNDLKLGGKKLCGILTEGQIEPESGRFAYAVIGVGINIKEVPREVSDIATALQLHTKRAIDRNLLAAYMIGEILKSLSENRALQMAEYRRLCPIVGKAVAVTRGEERFAARVLAIEEDGSLRLLCEGEEMRLSSGEISIRDIKETEDR